MPRPNTVTRKPPVYVADTEFERLSNLANSAATRGAAILADELERAIVVRAEKSPRAFVRLHSVVEFTDILTGKTRRVQLVPPDEADIDQDRLSVLSPVGASLLGLSTGDVIGMSPADGRAHVLEVRSVERAHVTA